MKKGTKKEVLMLFFGPATVGFVGLMEDVGHDSNILFLRFKIIIY